MEGSKETIESNVRTFDGPKVTIEGNIGTFDGPKVTTKGSKETTPDTGPDHGFFCGAKRRACADGRPDGTGTAHGTR